MACVALFAGLIIDEEGQPVEVAYVGAASHYVVDDAGFRRHLPSEQVDRQVLVMMQEGILSNRAAVVEGVMEMMGQEDLFTKAAVEASIDQMDENMEQLFKTGLPEDTRAWLGMLGFRIVIDHHGDVLEVQSPGASEFDM